MIFQDVVAILVYSTSAALESMQPKKKLLLHFAK
jgi:hypothetical protein